MGNKKTGLELSDINVKELAMALDVLNEHNIDILHPIINELIACAGYQQPFETSTNKKFFVCSSWRRDAARKNYVEIKILHKDVYSLS